MNKLTLTSLSIVLAASSANAAIVASDNFDGLAAGTALDSSADWNAKWNAAPSTQQNLYKADGAGAINLDMSVAEINYHAVNAAGFVVGAGGATISLDFNYTHNGAGNPTNLNKTFFGPTISTTPNWWDGGNQQLTLAQRGGAIGNTLPAAPWVENWVNHSALGVNHTGGVASTSSNIAVVWTLSEGAGGTIEGVGTYTHAGGTNTSSVIDTGIANGTTIYGGFSTGWNDVGGSLESATNISNLNIDNFEIETVVVPEPSSVLLASLSALGLLRRRR